MSKRSLILPFLILFLMAGSATAQKAKLNRANKYFSTLNYQDAIQTYLEVLDKRDISEAKIKLAESYRKIGNMSEAEFWFGQVVRLPEAESIHKLYYGMALQGNGKCEQAKEWFDNYTRDVPEDIRGVLLKESCETAMVNSLLTGNTAFYEINHIPEINSDLDDFGATIFRQGLVFASERDRGGPVKRIHSWTGNPFLEMYFVESTPIGEDQLKFRYGKPEKYSNKLNTKLHDGPLCFSADGNTVYFTRNNLIAGKLGRDDEGIVRLKIFSAKLVNEEWSELKGLPFNSDEYSVAHPSLSADGNNLYFTSDMPGGFGGMDLYVSTMVDGRWSPPINLNAYIPNINTEGNELFPTIHSDGTLHFASEGHTGLGGLDMYFTKQIDGAWGPVTNMGFPLNSINDDFGIVFNEDKTFGYFSSNREGGMGNDDIYSFRRMAADLEVIVIDEISGAPIEGAEVTFACTPGSPLITDADGKVYMEVALNQVCEFIATKESYSENKVSETTNDYKPGDKIFVQIPLFKPLEFDLIGTVTDDKGNPVPNANITLSSDCYEVPIVIVTDKNGNYEFDLDPDCCYLVKADKENFLTQTSDVCTRGLTTSLQLTSDISITPFKETITGSVTPTSPFDPNTINDEVLVSIRLPQIYYDFDKANLRRDASEDLETVLTILRKNPDLIIEIGSHTDSRGSKEYNEKLSLRRAESVIRYLTKNGINRERVKPRGWGESRPVNGCIDGVKCTSAQHQENRRTEMRVIGTLSSGLFQQYLDGK